MLVDKEYERFHHLLLDRHLTSVTDHKPSLVTLGPKSVILAISNSNLVEFAEMGHFLVITQI